ncbi:MAG: dihydropteroate synthase [Deltaproteobacteria bacterium]|nr:dihydropteroate synthase [Deltaproteobacteria bacterium]
MTPDSFSDGGHFLNPIEAVSQAQKMNKQGAHIIDIGGESTRPGSLPVDDVEEMSRVLPVLEILCREFNFTVSIDTTKAQVARKALEKGAKILNDVSGLSDSNMLDVIREHQPRVVLMHSKGTPQTMKGMTSTLCEITDFFKLKIQLLLSLGLSPDQIILDPGLGFGKTTADNWNILKNIRIFKSLGCSILLGASRKSFLGEFTGLAPAERDCATHAVSAWAYFQDIEYVRVHDVSGTSQTFKVLSQLKDFND